MYFEVNLIHMFLINLCLAHQNVVLRRKLIKKNRVMLHQPLMKSTPEDYGSVTKSDELRAQGDNGFQSLETHCCDLRKTMFNTWSGGEGELRFLVLGCIYFSFLDVFICSLY